MPKYETHRRYIDERLMDLEILVCKIRVCNREYKKTHDPKWQDALDRLIEKGCRLAVETCDWEARHVLRFSDIVGPATVEGVAG